MIVFDKTKYITVTFPFPCRHDLLKDHDDHYVLVCKSFRTGGGVAVNEMALDFLTDQPGDVSKKQLHLKSQDGWVWEGRLEDLPYKEPIPGNEKYPGEIRIYDRADLYPNHLPFASAPPQSPRLPAVRSPQPNENLISFAELKTRINATFTNPTMETLRDKSRIHPFSMVIDNGEISFRWKG